MKLKAGIKRLIPSQLLNATLLRFPRLYATRFVSYESNFQDPRIREELLRLLERTLNVPGDVIECGSSRCGTTVIMALYLQAKGSPKRILACDSFQGFDREELQRERNAGLTATPEDAFTSTSYSYVIKKLAVLRLSDRIRPIKGYFQETIPGLAGPFSFALIDCDLKESMLFAAEALWPRLSPGALMLFDDYGEAEFLGAKVGVDEFVSRREREIESHGLLDHFYFAQKPYGIE